MSAERCTVDTNILFYMLDGNTPEKQLRAENVLQSILENDGFLILQSLGELCNSTARKRPELSSDVQRFVSRSLAAFPIEIATPEDLQNALEARQRHGLQFWDAMLWATARRSGCSVLFSEDMQDGRLLGGVRFRNPFQMTELQLSSCFI